MKTLSDLISAVQAEQAEIAQAMTNGQPSTWDAYQRLVGEHAGLQKSLDILNNLLKEDDEDE